MERLDVYHQRDMYIIINTTRLTVIKRRVFVVCLNNLIEEEACEIITFFLKFMASQCVNIVYLFQELNSMPQYTH